MDTKRTGCCTGYKAKLWESIARPDHSWISNERLPGTRKKNTQKSNLRRRKEWTKIIIIIIILEENDVMNVSIRSVTSNTFSLPPLLIFLRLFPPYLTLLFPLSFSVCPFLFSLSVVDCFSSVLSILFCFPPLCLISFRRRQSASSAVARKPAGKMTKFVPNARNFYRWAPKEREREEGAGAFN